MRERRENRFVSDERANELRIPLRNLTLAAKVWGDPSAPPLLALHGWLDNAGTFDRLAPLLGGHHVVALDLAGHGRSGHRAPATWYPYADFLDEIGEVINWFGWSAVDLLGHSLGAALASTFAAVCPDKVRRLLLIEGIGPLTQPADKTLEQLRRSHSARVSFKGDGLRVFANLDDAIEARCRSGNLSPQAARCIVERGVRRVGASKFQPVQGADSELGNAGALADDESASKSNDVDSSLQQFHAVTTLGNKRGDAGLGLEEAQAFPNVSWSSDPQLTVPSPTRLTEEQLAAVLPAIKAPTFLVLAEPNAPYLPHAMVDARIALLADIEVVRMPGTHHLHLENPEPVAAAMHDFFARHPLIT